MKALILFYSVYGHVFELAKAVEEGVKAAGLEPVLRKAPETLPDKVIEAIGGLTPRKAWADVPDVQVQDMVDAEAIIIGSPTRFGGMCGQVRSFLDSTGGLFAKGALVGKVGAFFTSSNTQHGGQESTILTSLPFFLHQGLVYAGLPYSFAGQTSVEEIVGGSPYGASTVAGGDGSRRPTKIDLEGARFLGEHVGKITAKLRG
ncbi:NAD(P)H:quinone oxidoreductase [Deltaproteobacteria bacterium OttesenSCG-928-M10]|nr:NAD(P)H:quinone oxidoreductase [Deltaproteobacteria bacterium OttesenSCG-928-M10]